MARRSSRLLRSNQFLPGNIFFKQHSSSGDFILNNNTERFFNYLVVIILHLILVKLAPWTQFNLCFESIWLAWSLRLKLSLKSDFSFLLIMLIWRLFQNHRRYVKSRDDNQLLGLIDAVPSNECDPFHKEGTKYYIPCGAIANSMFSGKTMHSFNSNKTKNSFWKVFKISSKLR